MNIFDDGEVMGSFITALLIIIPLFISGVMMDKKKD